jgi:hypothetical protein
MLSGYSCRGTLLLCMSYPAAQAPALLHVNCSSKDHSGSTVCLRCTAYRPDALRECPEQLAVHLQALALPAGRKQRLPTQQLPKGAAQGRNMCNKTSLQQSHATQ